MNTKIVLWAADQEGHRHLLALELLPEENKVKMLSFPSSADDPGLHKVLQESWRRGQAVTLPEDHQQVVYPLSVTGGLLPENLRAEREDEALRTQHQWHFIVLSHKFYQNFERERLELKDRVEQAEAFDRDLWNGLKAYWEKVQVQVRDKNIIEEHARALRKGTDSLFNQMKDLRNRQDQDIAAKSTVAMEKLAAELEGLEARIAEGNKLKAVFEDLKKLQQAFRRTRLTREHRAQAKKRIDDAFQAVKKKRFGGVGRAESSLRHLERRYDGLIQAIEKMERSIQRDQKSMEYEARKVARSDGQLEAQIRQAKIVMIEERKNSKAKKLEELTKVREDLDRKRKKLERKVEKEKRREQARAQGPSKKQKPGSAAPSAMAIRGQVRRASQRLSALAKVLEQTKTGASGNRSH